MPRPGDVVLCWADAAHLAAPNRQPAAVGLVLHVFSDQHTAVQAWRPDGTAEHFGNLRFVGAEASVPSAGPFCTPAAAS